MLLIKENTLFDADLRFFLCLTTLFICLCFFFLLCLLCFFSLFIFFVFFDLFPSFSFLLCSHSFHCLFVSFFFFFLQKYCFLPFLLCSVSFFLLIGWHLGNFYLSKRLPQCLKKLVCWNYRIQKFVYYFMIRWINSLKIPKGCSNCLLLYYKINQSTKYAKRVSKFSVVHHEIWMLFPRNINISKWLTFTNLSNVSFFQGKINFLKWWVLGTWLIILREIWNWLDCKSMRKDCCEQRHSKGYVHAHMRTGIAMIFFFTQATQI